MTFEIIKFNGIEYPCRIVCGSECELLIGGTKLLDAIHPNGFDTENEGFVNDEAERIYDNIFFFVNDNDLKLSDEELIEILNVDNPEWFEVSKDEQIKKLSDKLSKQCDEFRNLWRDYVKEKGEISLGRNHITLVDGTTERMDKMIPEGDDVMLVDQFGHKFSLYADCGCDTLLELHDVVFMSNNKKD